MLLIDFFHDPHSICAKPITISPVPKYLTQWAVSEQITVPFALISNSAVLVVFAHKS